MRTMRRWIAEAKVTRSLSHRYGYFAMKYERIVWRWHMARIGAGMERDKAAIKASAERIEKGIRSDMAKFNRLAELNRGGGRNR